MEIIPSTMRGIIMGPHSRAFFTARLSDIGTKDNAGWKQKTILTDYTLGTLDFNTAMQCANLKRTSCPHGCLIVSQLILFSRQLEAMGFLLPSACPQTFWWKVLSRVLCRVTTDCTELQQLGYQRGYWWQKVMISDKHKHETYETYFRWLHWHSFSSTMSGKYIL